MVEKIVLKLSGRPAEVTLTPLLVLNRDSPSPVISSDTAASGSIARAAVSVKLILGASCAIPLSETLVICVCGGVLIAGVTMAGASDTFHAGELAAGSEEVIPPPP
ncbi:MAG: hypothetical protein ACLP36_11785, partial [Acidimicrobiales bacterium]